MQNKIRALRAYIYIYISCTDNHVHPVVYYEVELCEVERYKRWQPATKQGNKK